MSQNKLPLIPTPVWNRFSRFIALTNEEEIKSLMVFACWFLDKRIHQNAGSGYATRFFKSMDLEYQFQRDFPWCYAYTKAQEDIQIIPKQEFWRKSYIALVKAFDVQRTKLSELQVSYEKDALKLNCQTVFRILMATLFLNLQKKINVFFYLMH